MPNLTFSSSKRDHRTPFGLFIGDGASNGTIVHAGEVNNGLACQCICPLCSGQLIAAQGKIRQPHFRHHRPDTVCGGGYETALHLFAKQVLAKGPLWLPPVGSPLFRFSGWCKLEPERSQIEHRFDAFTPDVTIWGGSEVYLVEVRVTNPVSADKRRRIAEVGIPCIEVDLSGYSAFGLSVEEVREDILYRASRDWVYHPVLEELTALEKERAKLSMWSAQIKSYRKWLDQWIAGQVSRRAKRPAASQMSAASPIRSINRLAQPSRNPDRASRFGSSARHQSRPIEAADSGHLRRGWLEDRLPITATEPVVEDALASQPWQRFVDWHLNSIRSA